MKILVTGSSGQIGSYTVDIGREQGHEMIGLDVRPNPAWTQIVGDIRKEEQCEGAVEGVSAIVHCAAQISVQASIEKPSYDASINVLGTINLLQAAARAGVKRFVFVSSAAVYGHPQYIPIRESHPLEPLSPYGASKVAGEVYCNVFRELHNLEIVIARPFNVYSSRQDPSNPYSGVISRFVEAAVNGRPLIVFGSGMQTRDFIHASTVAEALIFMATAAGTVQQQPIINVATGVSTTILSLAEAIAPSRKMVLKKPGRAGEITHSVADASVLKSWGISPIPLQEGLKELIS